MNRSAFIAGLGALPVAASPLAAAAFGIREGTITTQQALFATLPRPVARDWTRVILGSGVPYQKQIGIGMEHDPSGRLLYYELQVGSPGGSCNPSSMRKAYLKSAQFGSLFDTYPLLSNIGRTENMVYRYGDVKGGSLQEKGDTSLRLLDEDYLYDPRPIRILSVAPARIHVSSANVDTTHVVAEFLGTPSKRQRVRRIQLWHSALFPFGVARYHATVAGLPPFDLHVYSHGKNFDSLLSLSLAKVRTMTKNGEYGQLPMSVGA